MCNLLKFLWILYLLPLLSFAGQGGILSYFEENLSFHSCERKMKEISFEATGPVHVESFYPVLPGEGVLIGHVNQKLKTEAEDHFDRSIQAEISSKEVWEDGCSLSYGLFPVYQSLNLISVYGCNFQGRGVHGCTHYEGKTFWQRGASVVELSLDDLFVKGAGYCQFLLQYCESYFKGSGYGYYSSRAELLPELVESDLDIFVLTDRGLLIIFRAYTVGGWADGPDTVLIPYRKLKKFINPLGVLKEVFD